LRFGDLGERAQPAERVGESGAGLVRCQPEHTAGVFDPLPAPERRAKERLVVIRGRQGRFGLRLTVAARQRGEGHEAERERDDRETVGGTHNGSW
jgi:hypothetical protein